MIQTNFAVVITENVHAIHLSRRSVSSTFDPWAAYIQAPIRSPHNPPKMPHSPLLLTTVPTFLIHTNQFQRDRSLAMPALMLGIRLRAFSVELLQSGALPALNTVLISKNAGNFDSICHVHYSNSKLDVALEPEAKAAAMHRQLHLLGT